MVSSSGANLFGILWIVRVYIFIALIAAAFVSPAVPVRAQDPPGSASQSGDFFSGNVVSVSATEITVNRKGLGKESAATRTFAIDANTKVEGAITARAHVTVRFVGDESSARAVHILVR